MDTTDAQTPQVQQTPRPAMAGTQAGPMKRPPPEAQTYGDHAVGLSFNPSQDPTVYEVKRLYARIIDICHNLRAETGDQDKQRLFSIAITEAQGAQMWAVKAVTWR